MYIYFYLYKTNYLLIKYKYNVGLNKQKMSTDFDMTNPLQVCRGCLTSYGDMKNMIEWGLAEDFYKLTNIQVRNSL